LIRCSALAWAAVLASLSGCALFGHHRETAEASAPRPPADWRMIATQADRDRIARWRDGWIAALAKARPRYGTYIAAEGALLHPDAALADPAPPPGDYRCRTIKIGAQSPGGLDYIAYPVFTCRVAVEGDMLSFAKVDGSQRPVGMLLPGDANRMIFLGTMMLGDETSALEYGRDAERDMAGALERVGPRRWRLVIPWPRWESMLDVIELTPKG
jgi:hypothetical protein